MILKSDGPSIVAIRRIYPVLNMANLSSKLSADVAALNLESANFFPTNGTPKAKASAT